ncbi:MAG: hypothetical protein NVS9B6_18880 [Candidatus Limnocylindrales bacterium]
MTVFEVIGAIPDDVGCVIAAADTILWRRDGRVHLATSDAPAVLLREAALADLRRRPAPDRIIERPSVSAEAHGCDQCPIRCGPGTIDRVDLQVVSLADATRSLLRRPLRSVPVPAGRRERCRQLLRERDVTYRASRVVWCPAGALRDEQLLRSFRPVVFDRGAAAPALERPAHAGELGTWLRG